MVWLVVVIRLEVFHLISMVGVEQVEIHTDMVDSEQVGSIEPHWYG